MNWKNLIAEIQKLGGLTQSEIGEECGTTQSTISSLINRPNAEPSHSLGEKLKRLHAKYRKAVATTAKAVANV